MQSWRNRTPAAGKAGIRRQLALWFEHCRTRLTGDCTLKRGCKKMPKKGITGHDEWVVTEALATALVALEQLPPVHQPRAHMDDVRKLLVAGCQPGTVNLHLAQAKCRLFPERDPLVIYQEYGLEEQG
jgi:hypothetical protein